MLNLVGRGYTERLVALRGEWGRGGVTPDWRGPGGDDVAAAAAGRRVDGPPHPKRRRRIEILVFPRILGRDYAAGGPGAFDALLRVADAAGLSLGERDDGWTSIGASILDASLGSSPDTLPAGTPALPCDAVGMEGWYPFSTFSRFLDSHLAHTRTDLAGLLVTFGAKAGHAEAVAACDCHWTIGSFLAGLIEGSTGKGWEDACWDAEMKPVQGPSIKMPGYPMAVAAHLALQVDRFGGEYRIPGFGAFSPRMVEPG